MAKETYNIKTDLFEGPFELLLYLVSKKRVDISAISVAEIADQYLREVSDMQALNLDIASDFLVVAATLLELKAHALIPQPADDTEMDIADLSAEEARTILVERLIEYKKFKNASDELAARFENVSRMHTRSFGPDPQFLGLMPDFLKDVSVEELVRLAALAMARREVFLLESEHIAAKPIPVEVQAKGIHARLVKEKHLKFSELVAHAESRDVAVAAFLAILELYKRQMVTLSQDSPFADISIDYVEGSEDFQMSDEDISYGGE